MHHITPYIPKTSVEGLTNLIENENLSIKVVKERITKHGDFRKLNNQNSVQNSQNTNIDNTLEHKAEYIKLLSVCISKKKKVL